MSHNEIRAEIEVEITRLQQARTCLDSDITTAQSTSGLSKVVIVTGSPIEINELSLTPEERTQISEAAKLRSAELKRSIDAKWSLY
jgi:cobyric acid synthase